MNKEELKEMVDIFIKDLGLDKEQERAIRMLASDVERTTRHKAVSMAYDLANAIHNLK